MIDVNTLIKGGRHLGIELDEKQIDNFIIYKKLLMEWNEKINITSIVEDAEIDIKHFIDSITPLTLNMDWQDINLIDVGTGGGFPGLPLKIMNRDINLVLLDSLRKRINFLEHLIEELSLEDVLPIHGRAEDLGKDRLHREQYDIAISRAVASMDTLCEYCLPFVKVGGYFIAMKGPDVEDEVDEASRAIKLLGARVKDIKLMLLPLSDIKHSLIIVEKIKRTPTKYPRRGNKAKKNPL